METNKKLKLLTWAVVVLIVANLTALISIFMKPKPPMVPKDKMLERQELHKGERKDPFLKDLQEELNWSDSQLKTVEDLKQAKFNNIEALRDSIPLVKKTLLEEIYKKPIDTAKISSLTKTLGDLQYRIEYNFFMHFTDIAGVSTEEQKKKMKDVFNAAILSGNSHSGNHEDSEESTTSQKK